MGLNSNNPLVILRNIDDTIGWNFSTKPSINSFFNPSSPSDTHFGIKTTAPTVALQVEGEISSSEKITTDSSISASKGINVTKITSTDDLTLDAIGDDIIFADGGTERFTFNLTTDPSMVIAASSQTAAISSTGKLNFESVGDTFFSPAGGNVGIGTTSPTSTLEVVGDISASGVVEANQLTASAVQFVGSGNAELVVQGHITASGDISASGGTITGVSGSFTHLNVLNIDSDLNPRFRVGRQDGEDIEINVGDNNNTIKAHQDVDGDQDHKFILDRDFAGSGENDFIIRKGGSDQLKIDKNGDSTFSGIHHVTHHSAGSFPDSEQYLPSPNFYVEGNTTTYLRQWIAPFDGSLEKIRLYAASAGGDTVCKLYVNAVIAGGATSTSDTVSVSATSTATFTFSSGNTYSAGDLIRITITPTDALGDINATCIWNYDTSTL